MNTKKPKIHYLAGENHEAQIALHELKQLYPHEENPRQADLLVVLGGDGFMLRILREQLTPDSELCGKPVYGMNRGTVGFLLNEYNQEYLIERLEKARAYVLNPLLAEVKDSNHAELSAHALNEVSLFRQTHQAATVDIHIDEVQRMAELVCDGVMVATPAGSTAYNLSVHGPILPVGANLLALTPISPFRPRRWRGALLSADASIEFKVKNSAKRPVGAVADNIEFRDVQSVKIGYDRSLKVTLLFDPEHNLEERILNEQFHG